MKRQGMGRGLGQGYKNLVSIYDSHVHSLSAKGVKSCMPSMKNMTLKGMGSMKMFDMHDGYTINCWSEDTRNGFRHIAVLMKNGSEVGRAKATYLNRTWESYSFQTVINNLLQKEFPKAEAQTRMKIIDDGKAGTLYAKGKKGVRSLYAQSNDLSPRYDSRASFYGKARVETEGNTQTLYSYNTKVAEIINGQAVVYGSYSTTTLRHIKDFLKQNGFKAESKSQILKDYDPSNKKPVTPKSPVPKLPINSRVNAKNVLNYIMEFEGGSPRTKDVIELFSYLIKTGQAWSLQGSYGRQAQGFIDAMVIDKSGKINWKNVADPEGKYYQ